MSNHCLLVRRKLALLIVYLISLIIRKYSEIWVEQCWRDILGIVWNLQNQTQRFNERVPIDSPVSVCFIASQQFLVSRAMIHKRPFEVWKKLLTIIGIDLEYDSVVMFILYGQENRASVTRVRWTMRICMPTTSSCPLSRRRTRACQDQRHPIYGVKMKQRLSLAGERTHRVR